MEIEISINCNEDFEHKLRYITCHLSFLYCGKHGIFTDYGKLTFEKDATIDLRNENIKLSMNFSNTKEHDIERNDSI